MALILLSRFLSSDSLRNEGFFIPSYALALDSKRMIAGFRGLRPAFQQAFRQASSVSSPVPYAIPGLFRHPLTLVNYVGKRLYVDKYRQQEAEKVLSNLKGKILKSE